MGAAFCIATCIQLQGVLSKQWHRDYRYKHSKFTPRLDTKAIAHVNLTVRRAIITHNKTIVNPSYTDLPVHPCASDFAASRGCLLPLGQQ